MNSKSADTKAETLSTQQKCLDIKNLAKLEPYGVEGVIIGKALYDKALSFKEARDILHAS